MKNLIIFLILFTCTIDTFSQKEGGNLTDDQIASLAVYLTQTITAGAPSTASSVPLKPD